MPATEMVMTTMFRTPAKITPAAMGSFTRSSSCIRVLPMPSAASRMSGSSEVRPT